MSGRAKLAAFVALALAGCAGEAPLAHPTLPADAQAAIRRTCEASAPQAPTPLPNACRDIGGDALALERCRSGSDDALLAAVRRSNAVQACLRAQGFR